MTASAKKARNQKGRNVMLTQEEELDLARAWLDNKDYDSRNKLVMAYNPLAVGMAAEVAQKTDRNLWKDLEQEAVAALTESIDNFDLSKGLRFGTYARWHIRGQLHRYVMDNTGITRVGTNLSDKKVFSRFRQMRSDYEKLTGHELDDEGRAEIAKQIGVKLDVVQRMEPRIVRSDVSLSRPTEYDDESDYSNFDIADENQMVEETVAARHDIRVIRDAVAGIMGKLDSDQRMVIEKRILARHPLSLQKISQRLGITKRRVQQLERHTLDQFRRSLEEQGMQAEDLLPSM